jgi:DNA invertase Pin-like site-specific DNA recombinase
MPVVGYAALDGRRGDSARQEARRQKEAIEAECERLGLSLLELVRERQPQRGHALERPGLGYALTLITDGAAEGLAVAELSRLAHSVPELGRVLEWFLRSDVRLVAASPALDTSDEAGRLTVRTLIEVSSREREKLAERTRIGMRVARQTGPRGVADHPELMERIVRLRAEGMTLQAIADRLNAEGVPTVRGGAKWRPSSVQTAARQQRGLPDADGPRVSTR